ncbi:hypothetical protein [Mycobacterium sp. SP-6446]|uniref:hypothetical protein n=1 Tax=Mycobacterium sp. SP-6446 TaxID=1834162 RepID=UPI00096E6F54|nr:hypothetical protein [Mycobacterium sp. SP-6446]OMC17178.1 hypothetical protein A5736_16765 [Mycobacterium sp. SP-6446]
MHIKRRLSVAAGVAAAAVGYACPAWADDGLSGTYNYVNQTGFTSTWTATPCGPGCAHVFTSHSAANYDLKLSNGRSVATVDSPDAVHCRDGTTAPATVTISVAAATLRGTSTTSTTVGVCGDPPRTYGPDTFTLTKVS